MAHLSLIKFLGSCVQADCKSLSFPLPPSLQHTTQLQPFTILALRRNHLWFKDQGTYLILSLDTSTTASIYACLGRARPILGDLNKKCLRLIY